MTQALDQQPVGNACGAAAAPRPSVPRPWPLTEGPGTKAGPELARGQVWGHNDSSDTRALPRRRPALTSQSLARLTSLKWTYFLVAALLTVNQNNFSASEHIWVSRAAGLSSGYRRPLRREEGKGGACGDTRVISRRGPREGPSKQPQGALPTREGHERVSAEGGEDLQTGPLSHTARVSASIFCSPCKLSGSWSWATLWRRAISGPPPYRLFRYTQVSSEICP